MYLNDMVVNYNIIIALVFKSNAIDLLRFYIGGLKMTIMMIDEYIIKNYI